MEELELIIQRMMDAGESEESIKAVVQEYSAGKQTDPVNVEARSGSEKDTASKSEDTFSESPFWNPNEENTKEKPGYLEKKFGKNGFTNFGDDLARVWEGGTAQGAGVNEAFDLFKLGKDMTEDQYKDLIESGRRLENAGQTDEMIYANQQMEKYKEDGDNGVVAFMKAYFNVDNPTVMAQYMTQSLVGMGRSLFDSEEVAGSAFAASGVGAGTGAGAGAALTAWSGPGALFGAGAGALAGSIGGFMGGLSGAMETGLTTAQLLQESAIEAGLNWGTMSDDARMAYVKRVVNNEVMFSDIKSKALARGITIGAIDGITGVVTGGAGSIVSKGVAKGTLSALTGVSRVAASGVAETTGGLASEYFGQKAAGQDFNLEEIMIEGFADKSFTAISVGKALAKGNPKYSINGQKLNGKEFHDALKLMDDEAYVSADISVENSPAVERTINNRRQNINLDQEIDSKVSGVDDRSELIKLEKQRLKLSKNKTRSGKQKLADVNSKIDEILSKYEGSEVDVTIDNRKKAIAKAIDDKFEASFNKNLEAVKPEAEKRGLDIDVNEDEDTYFQKIADDQGITLKQAKEKALGSDGVFVGNGKIFINKTQAKKVGAVSVASHEFLHPVLNALIGDAKQQGKFLKQFKSKVSSKNNSWVMKAMKAGGVDPSNYNTEYINYFSDGIQKEKISYDQGAMEKIGESLKRLFVGKGFDNISFDNGRDVYNFLKEYNTSIKKGKISDVASDAITEAENKKGAKVSEVGALDSDGQFSRTEDVQEINDIYSSNENKELAGFEIADKYRGMAESVFNSLKDGSNYTQNQKDVFDSKKEDMIATMLYDKIPSQKEDSKARNVVGLVQDFESKKQKYNNVAAYVNTFFKERSKEVFKYFSKDAVNEGLTKEDGTLKKSVSTKANETSNVDQGKKARELTSFDKLIKGDKSFIDPIMKKNIITKLTKYLKTMVFKGQFSAENITNEIKSLIKQEIEKAVVKRMGKISKTKAGVVVSEEYKSFHNENFNSIIKALPISTIKKKYLKLFESKKIAREKTGPGNAIFEIKPTSKGKFGAYFTIGGYTTLLARQKSLANEISAEIIKDQATMLKQDIDFVKELVEIADLKSVDINDLVIQTELESLANQFDRKKTEATKFDRLQFSKTLNPDQRSDVDKNSKAIGKLSKLGDSLTSKVLKFELGEILNSKVFSKKDIADYSNAIMKVLKSIHSDKNTLDLKLDLSKLINEKLSNDSVATNLTKALNLTSVDIFLNGVKTKFKNFGQIFTLRKYVDRQRRHYLSYAEANMNNIDDVVNQLKWFRGHMTTAGAKYFMIKRYQIFAGNKDFIIQLNKILKPKGFKIVTKTDISGGISVESIMKDGKIVLNLQEYNAKVKKPAQKSNSKAKLKEELEVRKVAAKEAWDNLINYLSYVKENGDVLDFAMTMMSLKSNMASMLKAAAPVEYYFSGKYSGTLVYEHIIPTEYIVLKLTQHFYGKSIDLEALRKRYKVAIVPKTMDNNINVFRQEIMPINWDVDQHETKRYFDSLTLGFENMFALESLSEVDSNGNPVIYGESHVKAQFSKTAKIKSENFNKAMMNARNPNAPEKGISVFDFDDTIAQSNSKVLYELPDGKNGSINATEFALQSADLEAAGAVFNFEEFSKVIEGKKGPLFDLAMKRQGKFTSKDIFILTARPQEAAFAIHAFLKGMGLTIPVDNITGLADGKPSAKADWIIGKAAEGYNNFYFADDAYKNVKAVQNVLDIIDVKRDVQLAKMQFSKNMGDSFNDILEQTKGVSSKKRFSKAAAESRGRDIGKWKFFLPPSAEDFVGLIYNFLGKGKVGEQQMDFFNKALVRPFARAMDELNRAKQAIATDFRALKKTYPEIKKLLAKVTPYNEFTYDTAVRVYIWTKNGKTIPGLSKTDIKRLNEIVENNSDLKAFADTLDTGVANNNYPDANGSWLVGNIATDLKDITDKIGRRQFLQEWLANKEVIFSKENLNKIEAIYGGNFREALEDMLYRMENGTNRSFGKNRLVNSFSNWVNNSVGAIMFLNMRSAILQTISFVNFVNWSDNNPLKFAAAILNVKQFSKDFVTLFNSDMLKQRRAGIGRDVNESEIAEAMSGAKNKPRAILNYLLRIGFTPTQLADSFAISVGGAAFYRNRINTYLKEGMTQEQALEQAFTDFQETSEVSQQSSRPDMISQQQAGPLGRLILAFQNTPMQYTRLMKKAFKDLINGRGDAKTNMSKIVYYGVVQNIIFASMQSALFAMLFDEDDDEDKYGKKKARIANTMTDSILRGSGLAGAGISTVKNVILKFLEQEEKGWNADHAYTVIEAANFSPPIGSKLRKLYSGIQTYKFNKDVIAHKGFALDNPAWQSAGNFVSAATNIPLDRAVNKYNNLRGASNNNNEAWQRIAMALGWSSWDVDAEIDPELKALKALLKKQNKRKNLRNRSKNSENLRKKREEIRKNNKN